MSRSRRRGQPARHAIQRSETNQPPSHSASEILPRPAGFDYAFVERSVAERVRSSAARIREKVKRTLEDIIDVGNELRAVKQALPHSQFGPWLRAEFGWSERTARNFMAVAEQFGPKTAMISDLAISPTAAYLLASPSAPAEARQAAIDQAEAGKQVTVAVARGLLAEAKKKEGTKPVLLPAEKLAHNFGKVLKIFRARWDSGRLEEMVRQLREFADRVEKAVRRGKRATE